MSADAVAGNLVIEPGEHAPGSTLDAAKLLARQTGGALGVLSAGTRALVTRLYISSSQTRSASFRSRA